VQTVGSKLSTKRSLHSANTCKSRNGDVDDPLKIDHSWGPAMIGGGIMLILIGILFVSVGYVLLP
jgi:hypothetical protein